jgi:hypothetical protein
MMEGRRFVTVCVPKCQRSQGSIGRREVMQNGLRDRDLRRLLFPAASETVAPLAAVATHPARQLYGLFCQ